MRMTDTFNKIYDELKKHEYYLNRDDEKKTNLYEAYVNGDKITKPRVQSIFRNIVKSIDNNAKVSFKKEYNFVPLINLNRWL